MERLQTCCVTGHRNIPIDKRELLHTKLRAEILRAIAEGNTHFISGFATGIDLIFADIVVELKAEYPITLEAAIPYPGRMTTPDKDFQRLIQACDVVKVHSSHYFKGCYMIRNRYMVDTSSLIISVYDGRASGGTAATIRYAHKAGKEIWKIPFNTRRI